MQAVISGVTTCKINRELFTILTLQPNLEQFKNETNIENAFRGSSDSIHSQDFAIQISIIVQVLKDIGEGKL